MQAEILHQLTSIDWNKLYCPSRSAKWHHCWMNSQSTEHAMILDFLRTSFVFFSSLKINLKLGLIRWFSHKTTSPLSYQFPSLHSKRSSWEVSLINRISGKNGDRVGESEETRNSPNTMILMKSCFKARSARIAGCKYIRESQTNTNVSQPPSSGQHVLLHKNRTLIGLKDNEISSQAP